MSWTIRKKLLTGFAASVLISVGIGLLTLMRISHMNQTTTEITTNWLPSVNYISSMDTNLSDYRIAELQHILSTKPDQRSDYEKQMNQVLDQFKKNQADYEQLINTDEERRLYDEFKRQFNEFLSEHESVMALSQKNRNDEARDLARGGEQHRFDEASATLLKLVELNQNGGKDASKSVNVAYNSVVLWTIISLVIGAVLGQGVGIWLSGSMGRPITAMARVADQLATQQLPQFAKAAQAIAAGDLTQHVEFKIEQVRATTNDEIGQMANSFNAVTESLGVIVTAFQQMIVNLREMAAIADLIAVGDLSSEITPSSARDRFGNAFKQMIANLRETAKVADKIAVGDLSTEIEPRSAKDSFGNAFKQMTVNLREMATTADQIAVGDLSSEIEPHSARDRFGNAFKQMIGNLREMAHVADRIAVGDLSTEVEPRSSRDSFGIAFRQMTLDLRKVASVADQIATGDLTAEIEQRSANDRFGTAFKQMIFNLREAVGQIDVGAQMMAMTSSQVAASSEETKKSTQILSSSSEEITATIQQMAASIRQVTSNSNSQAAAATETSTAIIQMVEGLRRIAEHTRQLASLTTETSEAAKTGQRTLEGTSHKLHRIGADVESAGQTIDRLGERAESIGKIVETIDDIADQTNLLALNAAIEAARAGEHGLGFAVVADEVRKLAERSARSTKEISDLIESIQRESRVAVEQMVQSNHTVKEYIADTSVRDSLVTILSSIERIVTFTHEIEAATSEQSSGADQVAKASQDLSHLTQEIKAATEEQSVGASEIVKNMDQLRGTVQQSVQLVSELQSAAEDLRGQSEFLNGVVSHFNLGQGHTSEAPKPPSSQKNKLQRRAAQGQR